MKNQLLILLFIFIAYPIPLKAQDLKVNIPRSEMSLGEAIEFIENQTRLKFIYDASSLDISKRVSFAEASGLLSGVLARVQEQTGYHVFRRNHYILVNTRSRTEAENTVTGPRTGDRYTPGDIKAPFIPVSPEVITEITYDTIVHYVEKPIVRTESFSSYTEVDLYSRMQYNLPLFAAKVNFLYGLATLTPNVALEFGLAPRHSIEIGASHNRWNYKASLRDNKKLMHWIVRPEYRYWLCERFDGHFIGGHLFYSGYNISEKNVPLLFDKEYRYKGWAIGGGVSYGYHLPLHKRWGLEFEAGLGVAYLKYDRYDCQLCSRNGDSRNKIYFGPTRVSVSLVFMIK